MIIPTTVRTSSTPESSASPTPSRSIGSIRSAAAMAMLAVAIAATTASALPPKDITDQQWKEIRLDKYQLENKSLGNQGYDPVAYFPEGDPKGKGRPAQGSKDTVHTHHGVTYRFSSEKNRELFRKNPAKYEPVYGGWCAYAAANETYTEPNPKNFKIQDGRLLLFYDSVFTDTHKLWEKEGPATLAQRADTWWRRETGERPPATPQTAKP